MKQKKYILEGKGADTDKTGMGGLSRLIKNIRLTFNLSITFNSDGENGTNEGLAGRKKKKTRAR